MISSLAPYFLWWRTTVVRDRQIVDAVVDPEHLRPTQEFQRALDGWPGLHYWAENDGRGRLVLIRLLAPPRKERWWLHVALFLVTFATVWMGGALLADWNGAIGLPLARNVLTSPDLLWRWVSQVFTLGPGLDFAMALMAILLAHETGHYLVAKRYGIDTSPPYFLPAPPWWNFIGTFGAFIRLRSPIVDRRQLIDVGAAGPWAGFVVALVALAAGLARSTVVPGAIESGQFIQAGNLQFYLGDSPIMIAARALFGGEGALRLHPLAFAGWVGLFVTMLNLLPLSQLDGGHILYALVGRWQTLVGPIVWLSLVMLSLVTGQWWWWVWAALILLLGLILGRGRLAHPQVLDPHRPLPKSRHPLGWVTLLLFAATFTPVPLTIHYL